MKSYVKKYADFDGNVHFAWNLLKVILLVCPLQRPLAWCWCPLALILSWLASVRIPFWLITRSGSSDGFRSFLCWWFRVSQLFHFEMWGSMLPETKLCWFCLRSALELRCSWKKSGYSYFQSVFSTFWAFHSPTGHIVRMSADFLVGS